MISGKVDMKTMVVKISEIIGSGYGVSASDGKLVYEKIAGHIADGNRVSISFESTTRLTTAFLNAAVGQLYGEFSAEKVKAALSPPTHTEAWQLNRLKIVVDRAKIFFADPVSTSAIMENDSGKPNDDV
jgi:hypothetical protein